MRNATERGERPESPSPGSPAAQRRWGGGGRLLLVMSLGLLVGLAGCSAKFNRAALSDTGPGMPKTRESLRVSAEGADAAEPALGTGNDGTTYVVWVEHLPGGGADVMVAHANQAGGLQGAPVRINEVPAQATAWRGDPPTIAVAPDGTVYVGWTGRVLPDSTHATNIYLSASHDAGKTFDPPVKINDDARPAVHGLHSLAVAADGRIFLAWLDERNITQPQPSSMANGHHMETNRELFFTSSVDRGHTFAPNQRVTGDVCPCCKTALAIASDGRIYLSWRQVLPGDYRHIAVSSSMDGRIFAKPVIVSDDQWVLKGCPVSGASLAVSAEGILRVLWYSAGTPETTGLYWSESRDGGRSFSPRDKVKEGLVRGTPVLLPGSRADSATAVWQDESQPSSLAWARFSAKEHSSVGVTLPEKVDSPAAAIISKRLVIAYVSSTKDKRGIWLTWADLAS